MWEIKYKHFEFKWLRITFYNKICYSLLGLGSTLIMDSYAFNWWDLFILEVHAKNIDLTFNQGSNLNIGELLLGLFFVVIAIILFLLRKKYELWYNTKYPQNLIAIKQEGLQSINFPNFNKRTSGKDFRSFDIHPVRIDEINFDKNRRYQDAITNQDRIIVDIANLKNSHLNHEIGYWGITRIPLAYSLGVKLGDTQSIHVFDFDRIKQKWTQLSYSWFKNKRIRVRRFKIKKSDCFINSSQDLILSISTTFNVPKDECLKVVPNYYKIYELSLPNIGSGKRDRFKTIDEITILSEQIRQLMDEISTNTQIKKVHLFYAGPTSLAFRIGTTFSEAIHPNVIVYNYTRNDTPCFSWAFNVLDNKIVKF